MIKVFFVKFLKLKIIKITKLKTVPVKSVVDPFISVKIINKTITNMKVIFSFFSVIKYKEYIMRLGAIIPRWEFS